MQRTELSSVSQKDENCSNEESPRPSKRTRTSRPDATASIIEDMFEPPYPAATDEEKQEWQGFCEIESDPAFFNAMLKQFGVKGAKVQEVFGLDEEMLGFLPQPVYGLIFLFQYLELDAGSQEDGCPDHVWFANQVTGNACATVALLNMVHNIPELELGEELQKFKDFTKPFSPALRGDQVANFRFVKQIHNSFARKIDMLNLDASLEEEHEDEMKKSRSKKKSKKRTTDGEAAFHFVAYLPIQDEIWRLDGLDPYPQKFGPCGTENWLDMVTPVLSARMADLSNGQTQFSLLALVRDPLVVAYENLAGNIKLLSAIESKLHSISPDWKGFAGSDPEDLIQNTDDSYGISSKMLESASISESDSKKLSIDDASSLIETRQLVMANQSSLKAAVISELRSSEMDDEKAADRQNDYGPFIQKWFSLIAENEQLKDLIA